MPTPDAYTHLTDLPSTDTMPFMFVGHGNPMNAITDTPFSRNWTEAGRRFAHTGGRHRSVRRITGM